MIGFVDSFFRNGRSRGQAAMEFLMTYGWVILIVLVVIGALGYFGVLSPSNLVPNQCHFSEGFVCDDFFVNDIGYFHFSLLNGKGEDITIVRMNIREDSGSFTGCGGGDGRNFTTFVHMNDGAKKKMQTLSISGGKTQGFYISGCNPTSPGVPVDAQVEIEYTSKRSGFTHIARGTVTTIVEHR